MFLGQHLCRTLISSYSISICALRQALVSDHGLKRQERKCKVNFKSRWELLVWPHLCVTSNMEGKGTSVQEGKPESWEPCKCLQTAARAP